VGNGFSNHTTFGHPVAHSLVADHASVTNPLRRGRLVVKIRWLHHTPSMDIPGHRTYTCVQGEDQVVWPVDCAVADLHHEAQEAKPDSRTRFATLCWRMPDETHDYMLNYDHGAALLS